MERAVGFCKSGHILFQREHMSNTSPIYHLSDDPKCIYLLVYIWWMTMVNCFLQDCPENPECTAFQQCAICAANPSASNCSEFNCSQTVGTVGDVDTATYRIDGSKYIIGKCLCQINDFIRLFSYKNIVL